MSLNSLAARHDRQMKSRETLAAKHNTALHTRIRNKVLTPVTHHTKYHVTEYINGVKTKVTKEKTTVKEKYRTSKVALTLKARSRAAHRIESEVARDKRR